MSQKLAKKIRRKLRDANALAYAENGKLERLLMKRKDLLKGEQVKKHAGGAINHPMSSRARYQLAKRKSRGV